MNEDFPQLGAVLEFDPHGVAGEQLTTLGETARTVAGTAVKLATSNAYWTQTGSTILSALDNVLRNRLDTVLVAGWNKYFPLREYRDRAKHPPGKLNRHTAFKHSVSAKLTPRVWLTISGTRIGNPIEFVAEFKLNFAELTFVISDARIMKIEPVKCTAVATLRIAGAMLAERKSKELALAEELSLGDGIPIV